jgi:hypothetical protein
MLSCWAAAISSGEGSFWMNASNSFLISPACFIFCKHRARRDRATPEIIRAPSHAVGRETRQAETVGKWSHTVYRIARNTQKSDENHCATEELKLHP